MSPRPLRTILGIETSCDDTSAAVLSVQGEVLSSVVSSQTSTHAPYGGVVPELASRQHLANLPAVVAEALRGAGLDFGDLDAVAVTAGPGLLGSVLVGLSYAKGLALSLGIPLKAVNHIEAHLTSPWIESPDTPWPALVLVVSGGHSHLFFCEAPSKVLLVAATRDDAAGEALDKIGKRMALPYPGGPVIDRLSERGDPAAFPFPLPRMAPGSLDFSFSGLKTAFLHRLRNEGIEPRADLASDARPQREYDLLASFQKRVVDHLVQRTRQSLARYHPASLAIAGGVACNRLLRSRIRSLAHDHGLACAVPSPGFCTDNAAMVAFNATDSLREGAAGRLLLEDAFSTSLWTSARAVPSDQRPVHR
jgi:N6-L-threonylcarbamoyladenine synthase